MRFQILAWLALAMIVSGCAGSPYQISRMDSEELAEVPNKELMQALENHRSRNDAIINEALNRGWLLEDDIPHIKKGNIAKGMSERALILAIGRPYRVNEKHGSWGIHKEYIYGGLGPDAIFTHVFLENGRVSRWEEEKRTTIETEPIETEDGQDDTEIIESEGGRDG